MMVKGIGWSDLQWGKRREVEKWKGWLKKYGGHTAACRHQNRFVQDSTWHCLKDCGWTKIAKDFKGDEE